MQDSIILNQKQLTMFSADSSNYRRVETHEHSRSAESEAFSSPSSWAIFRSKVAKNAVHKTDVLLTLALMIIIVPLLMFMLSMLQDNQDTQSSLKEMEKELSELSKMQRKKMEGTNTEIEAGLSQLLTNEEKENGAFNKEIEREFLKSITQLKNQFKGPEEEFQQKKEELSSQFSDSLKALWEQVPESNTQEQGQAFENIEIQEISKEESTPYVDRLVTTFKVKDAEPALPLLKLPTRNAIWQYMRRFQSELLYSFEFCKNPNAPLAIQTEYALLDEQFAFSKHSQEKPICVTASGWNFLKNDMYLKFLKSVNHQNYTNYRLILTDDASTDNSYEALKEEIKRLPRLAARTTIIKNHQNVGSLANNYLAIHGHCEKGSIVFDVDADDTLIGRQVMKVMNALYQSSENWVIYSNFVWLKNDYFIRGFSEPIDPKILADNRYRALSNWRTSHLKTYLRDLYVKVPKEYFIEEGNKFYFRDSDLFQIYPLVELAGPKHLRSIPKYFYCYRTTQKEPCSWSKVFYYKQVAKTQTPLLPLSSLDSEVEVTPNYVVPEKTLEEFKSAEEEYNECRKNDV